jgi:DNA primase
VLDYLRQRGLTDETIREWGLGFSPESSDGLYQASVSARFDKTLLISSGLVVVKDSGAEEVVDRFRMRLIFPIRDSQGRVIAFGGRTLKKGVEPKYLNSPETSMYRKSEVLFAFSSAKAAIRSSGKAMLVEGYMDAMACHQAGIDHVVAASGTAFTPEHAKILKRLADTFFLCFDNDYAGWEATKRAYLILQSVEASVYVVNIPSGKDPADSILHSPEEFQRAIASARPFFDVYLERCLLEGTLTSERIAAILAESLEYIRAIQNKILKDLAIRTLAARLSVKETFIYDELKRISKLSRPHAPIRIMKSDSSDPVHPHLKTLKPEELLLVCALKLPEKIPEIFEKLRGDDFSEDIRPIFVRIRDLVAEGHVSDFSAVSNGFPEAIQARIQYYLMYGESFYDELPLDIFEKDVKTALDKVIRNRKNMQLGALKGLIRHYQHEGKKSELIVALQQLREQLRD